ncbi:molybdopterin synthase catalytic subunit MoaE [Bowmanella dokdonensis]|uniref:Molybdopterin synthase catalytic subunit n=1 Tax=Bowmanella dokdonensis TaxID=751969 RepID=A0A939DLI0_9ALTE|nr:molybdopterin synthase catalytic subunit MoaE [Bowmanella dokdonensis]MBN7824365.1 molybdopterin synthase catalytic subunit MoaE [Bowmanella dokdonensis]
MHKDYIQVRVENFSLAEEYLQLCAGNRQDGAVVTFVGLVRDFNQDATVESLFLEHYPAMTDKSLRGIIQDARQRWNLGRIRLIHRVGNLTLGDQIVFVGVSARHRGDAFCACEFIMDNLKARAPFWKKEGTPSGDRWVEARQTDQDKARWWATR